MSQSACRRLVIPAWMPESSHRDVNPGVATKPFSNTEATDMSPSMALDSGILSRNDGNEAIMRIAAYFHCTGFSGKMDRVVVELIDVTHRPRAGASKLALTGKASFAFPISSQSKL